MGGNSSKNKKEKPKKRQSTPQNNVQENSTTYSQTITQRSYVISSTQSTTQHASTNPIHNLALPSTSGGLINQISAGNFQQPDHFDSPTWIKTGQFSTIATPKVTSRPPLLPSSFTVQPPRGPLANRYPSIRETTDLPSPTRRYRSQSTTAEIPSPSSNGGSPTIKISVKKVLTLQPDKVTKVPTYNTKGRRRGKCLIINNIDFHNEQKQRAGALYDSQNMINLFRQLKIDPQERKNLTIREMGKTLSSFASNSSWDSMDMSVVVITSHGTGSMDTMTEICGVDGGTMKVYDIITYFSEENCPKLKGKPKIFIFQCCRGSNKLEHDAQPTRPPKCADMLIAYSTMPGFVSWRDRDLGSLYIREICKVFMEHAYDTHVEDMLKQVGENLKKIQGNQQLTSFENMAFKNCYLNPV